MSFYDESISTAEHVKACQSLMDEASDPVRRFLRKHFTVEWYPLNWTRSMIVDLERLREGQ